MMMMIRIQEEGEEEEEEMKHQEVRLWKKAGAAEWNHRTQEALRRLKGAVFGYGASYSETFITYILIISHCLTIAGGKNKENIQRTRM